MEDLGHLGHVQLIHSMPELEEVSDGISNLDREVVHCARTSYGAERRPRGGDARLLRHLMRHRHTSPFEMVSVKLHIRCPVYVRTHFIRHRTAKVNELSQRFRASDGDAYIPDLRAQDPVNKQASVPASLDASLGGRISRHVDECRRLYEELLEEGVAREQARGVLPLGVYTEFVWCQDAHNLLKFIALRDADDAQHETQLFAQAIKRILRNLMPCTVDAFDRYWNPRTTLSLTRDELRNVRIKAVDNPWFESKSEEQEFWAKMKRVGS